MNKNEKVEMTTIPLGENKTLFVPLDDNGKFSNALGFFVKLDGVFEETVTIDKVFEYAQNATPVVAFRFKNKKSINDLIKFLRYYRDVIYKKNYSKSQEVE